MLTSLDLLIIVFIALSAAALLGTLLLFVLKKPIAKRIFLYFLTAVTLLACVFNGLVAVSAYLPGKLALGVLLGAVAVAGVVLHHVGKKKYAPLTAQIMVAASTVLSILLAAN